MHFFECLVRTNFGALARLVRTSGEATLRSVTSTTTTTAPPKQQPPPQPSQLRHGQATTAAQPTPSHLFFTGQGLMKQRMNPSSYRKQRPRARIHVTALRGVLDALPLPLKTFLRASSSRISSLGPRVYPIDTVYIWYELRHLQVYVHVVIALPLGIQRVGPNSLEV